MSIKITKKDRESSSAFLYRVSQVIQKSGVMLEAKKHKYNDQKQNKTSIKKSALHKQDVLNEIKRKKRLGIPFKK
jgi:hypothetical protein